MMPAKFPMYCMYCIPSPAPHVHYCFTSMSCVVLYGALHTRQNYFDHIPTTVDESSMRSLCRNLQCAEACGLRATC